MRRRLAFLTTAISLGLVGSTPAAAQTKAEERRAAAGEQLGRELRAIAERGGSTAEQRTFVANALRARKLPAKTVDGVLRYAVDGISLRTTTVPRTSRLGGAAPGLPGQAWPQNERSKRPLSLYAVLDLAEVGAQAPLPPDGRLAIFYEHDGVNNDRTEAWLDPAASTELRWIPPGTTTQDLVKPKRAAQFRSLPLAGTPMAIFGGFDWQLDVPGNRRTRAHVSDVLWGLTATAYGSEQLLGASRDIQAPSLTDIPLFFKEWASKPTRRTFTADERKGSGWTLAAQLSGAGTDEMMIADGGIVSFWVPTADLALRKFDRAIATFQSS